MTDEELIEFAKILEAEMSDDLKPCPFCGGEPFSFEDYGHSTAWEVGCSNSQCRVEPHVWEKTKDEAIASWNTRTPDTSIEALTAEREFFEEEWVSAVDKLNKAVELLTLCRDMFDKVAHPSDPLSKMLNDTLAELGETK